MFAWRDINTRGVARKKFSIAFIKLINFPERKRELFVMALINREILTSREVLQA